ncbi:H/ACA ribonucleoprotein complex subunit 2 [Phialemonium atrogriseum]|uniref:H/ACA ribonucleoprotein complex subunit 2 n=1 Tax=Phialemonium atrogriseum TaxID=1093897 RepID=A0AAJ0FJS1_9PEZI|nr:H/ACA ribonucleoprotein complex subunit 2 [Phialemonium atrogriseum]KAK1770906.1 H/ACA ribonucleoprotein complex subunit 2 [Phialemonium atrogriseum]
MASDKVEVADENRLRKEKKSKDKADRKEKKDKKRSESEGVHKDKKDKKKDKKKQDRLVQALDAHLQADVAASAGLKDDVDPEDLVKPADELVPFALPLADEKAHKKIFKLIKKGAKLKAIHRGVKECEKAIKKCPLKKASSAGQSPPGLVVIAGDISPMDVIMHFPILCEEHGVPYVFVRSRADLGVAACTKRATSVVMLRPEGKKAGPNAKKGAAEDEEMAEGEDKKVSAEEYLGAWRDLVKLAEKQWTVQVEPWVKGVHPLQLAGRENGGVA